MHQDQTIVDNNVIWKVKNISQNTNSASQCILSGIGGNNTLYSNAPIGSIIPYAVNNDLPTGYLICNGAAISRTEYRELYALLGTSFGDGDGSTTFNIPDLRDKFIEGSTTAGTEIEAGLPNIKGTLTTVNTYRTYLTNTAGSNGVVSWTIANKTNLSGGSGSGNSLNTLTIDASSTEGSIYSDSIDTVQPPALTMVYLIKALNDSTLLETPSNQITVSYKDTFTYIYPNDGTEENPANITVNSRYVLANPFPGYAVKAVAELLVNNTWGEMDNIIMYGSDAKTQGVTTNAYGDSIVIQTAITNLYGSSAKDGNPFNHQGASITSAPARVRVWKIGKIANSNVPDIQEVSVHNTITVDEDQYLANSFTYVYPGGGDASNPGNISNNTEYIVANPFPGYLVECRAELYYDNEWGSVQWNSIIYNSEWTARGVSVLQHNSNYISCTTGSTAVMNNPSYKFIINGCSWPYKSSSESLYTLPCRIRVWKVGKIPT